VLAGAWTDTGWPATMEGAVRSGHTAASLLLSQPARREPEREDQLTGGRA
jgi:monoamine oxidase